MDNPWTLTLAGWLGTYLLHSTVLLGVTWLILRRWRRLPDNGRETLWRVALFGGFLTATLQLQLGVGPDLAHLELSVPTSVTTTGPAPVDVPRLSTLDPQPELAPGGLAAVPSDRWLRMLLWLWAGGVLALALRHGGRRLRLQGMLADRAPVPVGQLRLRFHELRCRAGLPPHTRLTSSTRSRCPMAFGILRPEVCLPARMAVEMDFHQQACVLAHELAHLRARDPLWLLLEAVAAWVGFLQPLNRLACRRLRELAEFRCDAWAVRQGGSHVHMANALMTVAESYLAAGEPVPVYAGVNAMAMRGSALSRRVERIFANPSPNRSHGLGRSGRGVLLGSVVLGLAAVALAVPGVSLTAARHEPTGRLERWHDTAPSLKRLRRLEASLRDLQSDLDGIRGTLAGSLRHPEVRSILVKLQHRIRELQAEQQVLWREAIHAVRSKQHTDMTTRPTTSVEHDTRFRR